MRLSKLPMISQGLTKSRLEPTSVQLKGQGWLPVILKLVSKSKDYPRGLGSLKKSLISPFVEKLSGIRF